MQTSAVSLRTGSSHWETKVFDGSRERKYGKIELRKDLSMG